QTNDDLSHVGVGEGVAVAVRTHCVQVGTLGEGVGVADAVQVLAVLFGGILECTGGETGRLPADHQVAGAQRCAQTNAVVVSLVAVIQEAGAPADVTHGAAEVNTATSKRALALLAETEVQLHDFEVVATSQVPGLDLGGVDFSVELVVAGTNSQGAVSVQQSSGDQLDVAVGGGRHADGRTLDVPVVSSVGVKGVTHTEAEAGEVRRRVGDHVVGADRRHGGEGATNVGFFESVAEGAGYAAQPLGSEVGLTTQLEGTPVVALQTQGGLTTEQTAALSGLTSTQGVAAFQLEDGAQTVAQVFGTTQTPAVAVLNTVFDTGLSSLNTAVM